jgi:phosphatidylserine/phosphatidylglycerophosphate/cardiolipin synthase-like enzyme
MEIRMMEHLCRLTDADLQELATALRSGRLAGPYSTVSVDRIVASPFASHLADDLQQLAAQGFLPAQIAATIELMVQARRQRGIPEDLIDLVITGPEAPGSTNRDTSVVVRELFAHARQSVLVAGYAVYHGQRVFQALADRMHELPDLKVTMFLDVKRGPGDSSAARQIGRRFAERFRTKQWPGQRRLPEIYFDPRALETDSQKKACLHAKCIVVDRQELFVSSANFTEAAQERNLEVGLLIRSPTVAQRVQRHFESLVDAKLLVQLI